MAGAQFVFFDAGGTLLYPEPDVGDVYARFGRRHGIEVAPDELAAAFRAAFRAKKSEQIPQSREWWQDVVVTSFAAFGGTADLDALFNELFEYFALPEAWSLFPGALETIAALNQRGVRTGLISNWDDRLLGLLDGHGLTRLLDPIVISCRVGAEKPDPRIFRAALDESGVDAGSAIMVGDDLEADVEGALSVGMRAVLFDGTGRQSTAGPCIGRLPELTDHV